MTVPSILETIPRVLAGTREVPTPPGGGTGAGNTLADVFPGLSRWQPSQYRERPYSDTQVRANAYYRAHGRLDDQSQAEWNELRDYLRQIHNQRSSAVAQRLRRDGSISGDPETERIINLWKNRESAHENYQWLSEDFLREWLTGNRNNIDAAFARSAETDLGRRFLNRRLPDPERAPQTDGWLNLPDLLERVGTQQAKRIESAGNNYQTRQAALASALSNALAGNKYATNLEGRGGVLATRLAALRAELAAPLDITADPSYRSRRRSSLDALDTAFAAAGQLQSGARSRELVRRASEIASEEYSAAHARRLADIAARRGLAESEFDRRGAIDRYRSENFRKDTEAQFQTRQEAEATRLATLLQAIGQYGQGAGAALEYIADDQENELERRERDRIEALNIVLAKAGLDQQERASRREYKARRFGDKLGAIGDILGAIIPG